MLLPVQYNFYSIFYTSFFIAFNDVRSDFTSSSSSPPCHINCADGKGGARKEDEGQFKIQALLLMLRCGTAMNTSRNVGERKTGFNFIFV